MAAKAPWMMPGAPRVAKPSWLRLTAQVDPTPPPPSPPVVERMPSMPPPRSMRPSVPPPSSRRHPPAQIQSMREVELESEVVVLQNELQRVSAEAERMRARVMEESEPAIVALAFAIAKRVVGREVSADPTLVSAWIREAQAHLPNGEVFVAADVDVTDATTDASLAMGTAEVRDGASSIVVGVDARMAAMADALGVES